MKYDVYIDIGAGYTIAFPDQISKFKISRKVGTDNMEKFFYRISWGRIQFSNKPYLFKKTGNYVYRLFDYIHSDEFSYSQIIKIKFVTLTETIYGYFGKNDCTFDYDRKIITVEPSILDEYTAILENYEKEIEFGNYNYTNDAIKVNISEDYLKTVVDWPYPNGRAVGLPITPRNLVKEKDYQANGELYLYFDGNKPKDTLYEDTYYMFEGIHDVLTSSPLIGASYSLADRIEILGQTITPENRANMPDGYGDYELSKFRIYEGTKGGGLSGSRWRQLYCHTWFSREEVILVDEVDLDNQYGYKSPIGDGWNMRGSRIKNGKNAHLWTRKPFNGAYSDNWGDLFEFDNTGGTDFNWNWYRYVETELDYPGSGNSFDIASTIDLRSFIKYLLNNTSDELKLIDFKSTFFFNDFENELEVLKGTTGFNYVTGSKNLLNNTKILFCEQLMPKSDDSVKNNPKYSLVDVLSDLNNLFFNTLTWFIDDNGYFRIEHIRWADLRKIPLDVSNQKLLDYTRYWTFDKTNMFETFEISTVNSGYPDFTNSKVTYDKIISNNRNQDLKKTIETKIFTTDARYCIMNPSDIKEGIILLATDGNQVINASGIISNTVEVNGALALSRILNDYCRYEGIWHNGIINNNPVTFTTTQRNKLGIELKIKGIKKSLFYRTQIGVGIIEDGEVDYDNENTSIKLRYRYNSNVNGDTFVLVFQKETDFSGALNNWADIDNYTL